MVNSTSLELSFNNLRKKSNLENYEFVDFVKSLNDFIKKNSDKLFDSKKIEFAVFNLKDDEFKNCMNTLNSSSSKFVLQNYINNYIEKEVYSIESNVSYNEYSLADTRKAMFDLKPVNR